MFRRKRDAADLRHEAEARDTLERLGVLTDRLEDTTQQLAELVEHLRHDQHLEDRRA